MRAMVGKLDITEHVENVFDALVSSLDWGSDFLDSEQVNSMLVLAELLGFDTPTLSDKPANLWRVGFAETPPMWDRTQHFSGLPADAWAADYRSWQNKKQEALKKWAKQRGAEIAAKLQDETEA